MSKRSDIYLELEMKFLKLLKGTIPNVKLTTIQAKKDIKMLKQKHKQVYKQLTSMITDNRVVAYIHKNDYIREWGMHCW